MVINIFVKNQIVKLSYNKKNYKAYKDVIYNIEDNFILIHAEDLCTGSNIKVKVICDYCGKEYEVPYNHYITSTGKYPKIACQKCIGVKANEITLEKRQEEIYNKVIKKCKEFGYTLLTKKSNLKNMQSKINYICPKHGLQETKATNLQQGKQCRFCANEVRGHKSKKMWNKNQNERSDKYYKKCMEICKEENYVLLTDKSKIINRDCYIEYSCLIHGRHKVKVENLLNGERCPKCRLLEASERLRHNIEYITKMIKEAGGKLLNGEDYINNQKKNLKILCPCCKEEILITSFSNFLQHGGQSCKKCRGKESVGERKIRTYLTNNNINFEQEKRFDDCKDVNSLPFDFYLQDYNMLIEYDGEQHFKDTKFFNGVTFEYVQAHDKIKDNYCMLNNIKLLRIPYTQLKNIDSILDQQINKFT